MRISDELLEFYTGLLLSPEAEMPEGTSETMLRYAPLILGFSEVFIETVNPSLNRTLGDHYRQILEDISETGVIINRVGTVDGKDRPIQAVVLPWHSIALITFTSPRETAELVEFGDIPEVDKVSNEDAIRPGAWKDED